jgi:hypothetical protein
MRALAPTASNLANKAGRDNDIKCVDALQRLYLERTYAR